MMEKKDFKPCAFCGRGMMHSGHVTFYSILLEQRAINIDAVRKQSGLEMMLGNPALAQIFTLERNLAFVEPVSDVLLLVCQPCALKSIDIVEIIERGEDE